jgi:hypothetical protein
LTASDAFIHTGFNVTETLGAGHPTIEKQDPPSHLPLTASPRTGFQGLRVTSDGGLVLVREQDGRLGCGELVAQHLTDSQRGKDTQLRPADLLRQPVHGRIAGYEDVNDAGRTLQDPAFRLAGPE